MCLWERQDRETERTLKLENYILHFPIILEAKMCILIHIYEHNKFNLLWCEINLSFKMFY